MAAISELEEVRLGMTTDELRQLADMRGWDHNVGRASIVNLIPSGGAVGRFVVDLVADKVAKVQAQYVPPAPDRVAAFMKRAPRLSQYPEIGLVGWADVQAGVAALAAIDGSQATLADLRAIDASEVAGFVDLLAQQK